MKQPNSFSTLHLSDHTLISHKDQQHDIMMIFFSGKNDFRNTISEMVEGLYNSYDELFRTFAEELYAKSNLKIKIMVPYQQEISIPNQPGKTVKGWFEYDRVIKYWIPDGVSGEYITHLLNTYNRENDEKMMKFVENQINMFNNKQNVILSGFSQGGRYVSHILQRLQKKYPNNFKIGFAYMMLSFPVNIFKGENLKENETN